jgi:hypothetical protein
MAHFLRLPLALSSILGSFFSSPRQKRRFTQAFFFWPPLAYRQSLVMTFDIRALAAGAAFGLLTAIGPWFQGLPFAAAAGFAAGLFLTYASIGLLVGILPDFGHRLRTGALIGLLYSIPGAVFTAVPYPLVEDAPAYYREFVGGGPRAMILTLLFGSLAGTISAGSRKKGTQLI